MDALLALQQPERVPTLDHEGRRRDPGLRTPLDLVELGAEAAALGPAQVHAQQHLGPVLGIRPTRTRVDLADGIALVVLAREQRSQLQLVEIGGQGGDPGFDLRLDRVVTLLTPQVEQGLDLGQALLEAVEDHEVVAHLRELGVHLARPFLVLPQVRLARFPLEFAQSCPRRVDLEIGARVVDAAAEIGQGFGEVAHRAGCSSGCRGSATVTVLELLAAPAVAGLVAAGGLLDAHRLLHDVLRTLGDRSRRRSGTGPVTHAVGHRLLERLAGGPGLQRPRTLHGRVGGRVPDVARLTAGGVVGDDLEMRHVADEVFLHAGHHRREHVEAFALPLGQRILLSHRAQVDALAQVVHLVEVLAPVLVDHREHHAPLDLAQRVAADRLLFLLVELHRVVGEYLHDLLAVGQVELLERDPRRERALDLRVQLLEVPLLGVLGRAPLLDRIADRAFDRNAVEKWCPTEYPEEWDLEELHTQVQSTFPTRITLEQLDLPDREPVVEVLTDDAVQLYEQKEQTIGSDALREIERRVMLSVIDQHWREHLYEMDYLREGINLRAMGQKDPLAEWQREGFDMFTAMMAGVQENFVRYVPHPQVVPDDAPRRQASNVRYSAADAPVQGSQALQAAAAGQPLEEPVADGMGDGSGAAPTATAVAERPEDVVQQPVRVEKTPGRNEPCYCGSGKKFKHCHGR